MPVSGRPSLTRPGSSASIARYHASSESRSRTWISKPWRALAVGVPPAPQLVHRDVGDEEEIGERVATGGERLARDVPLELPFALRGLAGLPQRPDVMELERIRVDDDEAVASLLLEHLVPSGHVAFDPEARRRLCIDRHGGVIGKSFEERMRSAVPSRPRRLACAARSFDDDDHGRSIVAPSWAAKSPLRSCFRYRTSVLFGG
jgi:hypothetical protein